MDPKLLLLKHFEKIVLGVFVLWMLYVASGLLGTPEALTKADGVGVAMTKVQNYVNNQASLEPAKGPGWKAELERKLDPQSIPAARPWPTWISHRRPGIVYYVEVVNKEFTALHGGPIDVTGDTSTQGQIQLNWGVSPDTRYVTVSYEIYRSIDGENEWEKIGETEELSLVDKDISTRRAYVYKVERSRAGQDRRDLLRPRGDRALNDADKRVESNVVGPFATEREIQVIPISTDPMTEEIEIKNPDFEESCNLIVRKLLDGKWEEKAFYRVKIGDPIGEQKGRQDFTTGATLKDVLEDETPEDGFKPIKAIVIEWPDGQTETVKSDDPKIGEK
ncbi:MAG: hypothetical protein R3F62_13115 [Planctomycetota bacterium]